MTFLERVEGDLRRRREGEAVSPAVLDRQENGRSSYGSYAANARRREEDWFTQYS